jgi:hypothetical protein
VITLPSTPNYSDPTRTENRETENRQRGGLFPIFIMN